MKYLIASDIHGSAYYCEKLLEQFEKQNADKLILLGDILYHGARNDPPFGYEPKVVIDMLNDISDKIICVRGNCDSDVDQTVLEFPIMAEYALMPYKDKTILITHGHKYGKDNYKTYDNVMNAYKEALAAYNNKDSIVNNNEMPIKPDLQPLPFLNAGDILLQGHTHVSGFREMPNGAINVNPGSISLPKSGSSHGYMTFEDGLFIRYNLNGSAEEKYNMNQVAEPDQIAANETNADSVEENAANETSAE